MNEPRTSRSHKIVAELIAAGEMTLGDALAALDLPMVADARELLTRWVEQQQAEARERVVVMHEAEVERRIAAREVEAEAARAARIAADVADYEEFHARPAGTA